MCARQLLELSEASYLTVVDWFIPATAARSPTTHILAAMGLTQRRWEGQVRGTESIYWRATGSVDSLLALTEQLGQQWLRGMRAVMALEKPR